MNKRISVHITSKDRSSELSVLLHSLRNQTYKDWDLVLLDDQYGTPLASNFKYIHDLLGRLRIEGHGIQMIRNNISMGVCKARQQLIQEDLWKDNPYILRLDDDQILEPDYIQRLMKVMEDYGDCGIASGVTPIFMGPDFKRSVEKVKDVINKITFKDNDEINYADDCGMMYLEDEVIEAHTFRSSALIHRDVFNDVEYEKGLSLTGFREEAYLSLRALMNGWRCYVDTGAIAWHAPCMFGGCRAPDYAQRVQLDNQKFFDWLKQHKQQLQEAGI